MDVDAALKIATTIADVAPTHRQCTIEITNNSTKYSLCNPSVHTERGTCDMPLIHFIASSNSYTTRFVKTPHTACGSVGVFTYDLQHNDTKQKNEKIAVMFSVPYDFNLYQNWYAVGVFDLSKTCDSNLFNEMYYKTDTSFIRGKACDPYLVYKGSDVTIAAGMSDTYQPVMKVQVTDKTE